MSIKRKISEDLHHDPSASCGHTKRPNFGKRVLDKYRQNGQDLARQGKYEESIQVFSYALLQENANMSDILDNRSAVYCKLGQYDKALSDAKRLIRSDSQDERGYLRAAKALILTHKPEKALEVYAYALKSIDKYHPQREVLEKLRSKLSAKLESQCKDPIQTLNNDCLLQIFEYIPFMQRVKLTRVCRSWKAYITGQSSLWSDISFKGGRSPVSPETVRACIRYSGQRLRKTQIHNVKNFLNAIQQISRCPKLEHLDIDGVAAQEHILSLFRRKYTLRSIIISKKVTLGRMAMIELLKLPNLEHFEAGHQITPEDQMDESQCVRTPNLKSFTLNLSCYLNSAMNFRPQWANTTTLEKKEYEEKERQLRLVDPIPKLEVLRLVRDQSTSRGVSLSPLWFCSPKFRTLDFRSLHLMLKWSFPENLENLFLIDCTIAFATENFLPFKLPKLKSLVLCQLVWLRTIHLEKFLTHNSGALDTLQIEQCEGIQSTDTLETLKALPDALKNLKVLHLSGMGFYSLDDNLVIDFISGTRLKELHLAHCQVTGSLIKKIVQWRNLVSKEDEFFPRIDVLSIKGCVEVSPEAFEWGRANGLKILK
ncbi:leucine rich repeat domain protein [Talaromyces proteolyticus]|uniref:Leucine rich repeat domain protein n=1 Tax=Talaromyces proteolyticus TaxID=1131652 RepID=A0AAD4KJF7_9EURO|nr:leucine rich repeat domain protein [Talaromyces proteolyticus]KAH8692379.1 leucine rich repeat domain protein [Talaromyces proteolyticus]